MHESGVIKAIPNQMILIKTFLIMGGVTRIYSNVKEYIYLFLFFFLVYYNHLNIIQRSYQNKYILYKDIIF